MSRSDVEISPVSSKLDHFSEKKAQLFDVLVATLSWPDSVCLKMAMIGSHTCPPRFGTRGRAVKENYLRWPGNDRPLHGAGGAESLPCYIRQVP